jgi:hypothetical protein
LARGVRGDLLEISLTQGHTKCQGIITQFERFIVARREMARSNLDEETRHGIAFVVWTVTSKKNLTYSLVMIFCMEKNDWGITPRANSQKDEAGKDVTCHPSLDR